MTITAWTSAFELGRLTSCGRGPDVGDGAIEAIGLPTHLVALAVVEGSPEHGEADGVGVLRRVGERSLAVDTDQDREPLLMRAHRAHRVEPVVLAGEGDLLAVEEPPQDDDGLGEAGLPRRGRVERDADRLILRERVPGADAELDAASGEMVERRDLARQVHRMTEVVVEDERAHANVLRRLGDRCQRRERRPHSPTWSAVCTTSKPSGLRCLATRPQLGGGCDRRELKSEAEAAHAGRS